jgi:hypothetical protein
VKAFGATRAVDGIDPDITAGTVYGVLGHEVARPVAAVRPGSA